MRDTPDLHVERAVDPRPQAEIPGMGPEAGAEARGTMARAVQTIGRNKQGMFQLET
jgi:hypothetical protein